MQILLVLVGLFAAAGGVFMLFRQAANRNASARTPYAPLAITFIGLMVAYRAYTNYQILDNMDILIMFLFLFALLTMLGLQFFIVDRQKKE